MFSESSSAAGCKGFHRGLEKRQPLIPQSQRGDPGEGV